MTLTDYQAEEDYRRKERLGIMAGDREHTLQQEAWAKAETDRELDRLRAEEIFGE